MSVSIVDIIDGNIWEYLIIEHWCCIEVLKHDFQTKHWATVWQLEKNAVMIQT